MEEEGPKVSAPGLNKKGRGADKKGPTFGGATRPKVKPSRSRASSQDRAQRRQPVKYSVHPNRFHEYQHQTAVEERLDHPNRFHSLPTRASAAGEKGRAGKIDYGMQSVQWI